MSDSTFDRYGRPAIAVVVLSMALLSVFSGYLRFEQQGVVALADSAVSVYIAGLMLWGLFREGFGTDRFRVLLYLGLVLWGSVDFLIGTDSTISLVILIGGALLLGRAAYQYAQRRQKPVYDR
ncbi:hypothetical protein C461_09946 [Halorubrum aidingense JCM 13560]|uniref:Uncharacterized protein n=1 Tax=Halorubrum aidingense JCM 13560 TaxID=1230454 RepID=M0PB99_9EURY|nr:hypothetical protein [Halorubrum aidingense]EMA66824.1 hypothetical protein C461_09946 [Halorubrum aidingense JCM 13560]